MVEVVSFYSGHMKKKSMGDGVGVRAGGLGKGTRDGPTS